MSTFGWPTVGRQSMSTVSFSSDSSSSRSKRNWATARSYSSVEARFLSIMQHISVTTRVPSRARPGCTHTNSGSPAPMRGAPSRRGKFAARHVRWSLSIEEARATSPSRAVRKRWRVAAGTVGNSDASGHSGEPSVPDPVGMPADPGLSGPPCRLMTTHRPRGCVWAVCV